MTKASMPKKGYKTYPYLLGGLRVDRPSQGGCADITYLPMRRGVWHSLEPVAAYASQSTSWETAKQAG